MQLRTTAPQRTAIRTTPLVLLATLLALPVVPRTSRADALPGIIETVVGGRTGDGHMAANAIVDPRGLAFCPRVVGGAVDLYIADGKGNRVRRVDAVTGVVSTIAGTGVPGFAGDGGPATEAQLSFPLDIACDASGTIYVADGFANRRVRKVDRNAQLPATANTSSPATTSSQRRRR
jgi:hypothetical protein